MTIQSVRQLRFTQGRNLRYWWQLLSPMRFVDKNFSPTFVCGISGSGTSLLASLLFQHYDFSLFLNESARIPNAKPVLFIDKMGRYCNLDEFQLDLAIDSQFTGLDIQKQLQKLYRKETIYPKKNHFILDKGPNAHLMRGLALHQAKPESKFLLIYRDPAETVEGLRRKWPTIMGVVDLVEVCNFYQALYATFIEESKLFRDQVVFISYDTLIRQGEGLIDQLAAFIGIPAREEKAILPERKKQPGKGVRNVAGGEIEIVKDAYQDVEKSISEQEEEFVNTKLSSIHQQLQQLESESMNDLLNV